MTDSDVIAQLAPHHTQCSGCGQVDNDPVAHYGDDRYHFDCLPEDVKADILYSLPPSERKRIETVIAHATADGVEHLHGNDLRVKHVELDPRQPAHVKESLGIKTATPPAKKATARTSTAKGKSNG